MSSTFVTFSKVCQFHKIPKDFWKLNGQYNYIEFFNGSRIDLLDAKHNPSDPLFERFGSLEYTNGFIEEAGEISFLAFDVLKSRVGRHRNEEFKLLPKIGLTCNPSKNFLYGLFYKPYKEATLPSHYSFIPALYTDNKYTAEAYGKQLSEIADKAMRERLMFGNWEYDDDPTALIKYDAILDLFTNTSEEGEKYISADIARYGQDKTVIGYWNGFDLEELVVLEGKGVDESARAINNLADKYGVGRSRIVIDEDGIGGGVLDLLKGAKGFIANSAAILDITGSNFRNLKSQCSYKLADMVNSRQLAIRAPISVTHKEYIIADLEQIKSKNADRDKKREVVSKDEVKEHLGRSPDFGDMIMMRMFFEVMKINKSTAQLVTPTEFSYRINTRYN